MVSLDRNIEGCTIGGHKVVGGSSSPVSLNFLARLFELKFSRAEGFSVARQCSGRSSTPRNTSRSIISRCFPGDHSCLLDASLRRSLIRSVPIEYLDRYQRRSRVGGSISRNCSALPPRSPIFLDPLFLPLAMGANGRTYSVEARSRSRSTFLAHQSVLVA